MTNEEIIKRIKILLNGVDREMKKHYKREENREKKLNELYKKIEFWSNKLIENN